ncbi:hypothetical protein PNOK_0287600 [Pyrrhoderma noxium]|uniref:HMG box domain-containing protein n=1 Tax=Pyrrhoderma noxium TaxID=2282107 RepID=A0A286UTL9_9AGAM|nr:hypothetical protein PNOK_0287600 [Pyrrhoderma noxium]
MARTATQTSTKAATRAANSKTKGANGESKPKRAPSAYNLFMKEQLKKWREANPSAPIKRVWDMLQNSGAMPLRTLTVAKLMKRANP